MRHPRPEVMCSLAALTLALVACGTDELEPPGDADALSSFTTSAAYLAWTDTNNGRADYVVERRAGEVGDYQLLNVLHGSATTYVDAAVTSAEHYFYRLHAQRAEARSSPVEIDGWTIDLPRPPDPHPPDSPTCLPPSDLYLTVELGPEYATVTIVWTNANELPTDFTLRSQAYGSHNIYDVMTYDEVVSDATMTYQAPVLRVGTAPDVFHTFFTIVGVDSAGCKSISGELDAAIPSPERP